jgi:hypothetical protein
VEEEEESDDEEDDSDEEEYAEESDEEDEDGSGSDDEDQTYLTQYPIFLLYPNLTQFSYLTPTLPSFLTLPQPYPIFLPSLLRGPTSIERFTTLSLNSPIVISPRRASTAHEIGFSTPSTNPLLISAFADHAPALLLVML